MLLSSPAGSRMMGYRRRDIVHEENRLPAEIMDLLDGLDGELQDGGCDQRVAACGLELDDLPVDRGIREFVGR